MVRDSRSMRGTLVCIGLSALFGGSACTSSGEDEAAASAKAGEEFSVGFDNTENVSPQFVLSRDDRPIYLLTPEFGSDEPSAVAIEGNSYSRHASAMRIADGESLKFRLPNDLQPGQHKLCSSQDECLSIEVE